MYAICLHSTDRRPIKVKVDCCQEVSRAKVVDAITSFKKQPAADKCVEAVM
uniref:Uncharacterized protein n=1 Tax=Leptobrachium leishanense TaxID=445787 RepID=A0A8C5PA75_9ANUR